MPQPKCHRLLLRLDPKIASRLSQGPVGQEVKQANIQATAGRQNSTTAFLVNSREILVLFCFEKNMC